LRDAIFDVFLAAKYASRFDGIRCKYARSAGLGFGYDQGKIVSAGVLFYAARDSGSNITLWRKNAALNKFNVLFHSPTFLLRATSSGSNPAILVSA